MMVQERTLGYSLFGKKNILMKMYCSANCWYTLSKGTSAFYSFCGQIGTASMCKFILKISLAYLTISRYIMILACATFCPFCEHWEQQKEPTPQIRRPRLSCASYETWIFPNWYGSQMERSTHLNISSTNWAQMRCRDIYLMCSI